MKPTQLLAMLVAVALAVVGIASCASEATPHPDDGGSRGSSSGPSHLPCDVDAVLDANCRQCHGAEQKFGAPMPLVTWDDLQAPAHSRSSAKVYELVGARIHDDVKPMPQSPNPRLDPVATKTLDAFIAAGAPRSDEDCHPDASAGDGSVVDPLACDPDTHLAPASPWTMPETTGDEYVCYGVDVPVASKRHAIALAPRIQNTKIVHHVLLFQAPGSVSGTPAACPSGGSAKWRLVFGWAPGGKNLALPPEAGFPEEGTTHWVVQVHYNNVQRLTGETDTSGFDLCTTDKLRPNDADVMAFGSTKFTIPKQSTYDITCSITVPNGLKDLHAFAAIPHMHKRGKAMATTQIIGGGTGARNDMGAMPNWDFQNQSWLPITATMNAGDSIETRCAWTNPDPQEVSFGEKTEDEMCYSFTMYYPRIVSPLWSWAVPASTSTCVDTK
jgi:Copper type II ascorbate-dependent monooxygenase, N-terminal domain/Copper type II ascorbate-dependent monooxygenase, C-terminal domain